MQAAVNIKIRKDLSVLAKISILIPCYNEEENVAAMAQELTALLQYKLSNYEYEIIFIDNNSTDLTRSIIKKLCANDKNIKAIFNAKNFGSLRSPVYGMMQTTGDCVIMLCCDFQDPIELIPQMVKEWENGNKIIVMQKTTSEENKFMYFVRTCYYKLIHKFSDNVEQIEHFTGFGLYDKSFVKIMKDLKDPVPFLRGIVAELGYKVKIIPYQQKKRRAGKSHENFYSLYNTAMVSFTSYTKIGLRLATFIGGIVALVSLLIALIYFLLKLFYWNTFSMGQAPILIGMFFLGAVQLLFLGAMGEYILSIHQRIMNRPLVIEDERINFE